jgi:hypothetical protein
MRHNEGLRQIKIGTMKKMHTRIEHNLGRDRGIMWLEKNKA